MPILGIFQRQRFLLDGPNKRRYNFKEDCSQATTHRQSLLVTQHMDQRHSGGGSCTGFTQPKRSAVSGQRYVSRGEESTRSALTARTRLAILTTSVQFENSVFGETDVQAPCLSTRILHGHSSLEEAHCYMAASRRPGYARMS